MQKKLLFMSFVLTQLLALQLSAADTEKYRPNPPLFYAALANASYKPEKSRVKKSLNKHLGNGKATVLKRERYEGLGSTNIILVKDKAGHKHAAIEGSSNIGNWVGNLVYTANGLIHGHDVPESILSGIHKIINKWSKELGPIDTISGHSQGGMFASQLAHYKKDAYKNTNIITFNAYKPKKANGQLHFALATERFATLCSPTGRYIQVSGGGSELKVISNHKMKAVLKALEHKSWKQIL